MSQLRCPTLVQPCYIQIGKQQITVASTLVVDDAVLRYRYLQTKKPARFFILTRDPADWLWAAWNFWLDSELDLKPAEFADRGWASQKLQYLSPELFHELLLGGRSCQKPQLVSSFARCGSQ